MNWTGGQLTRSARQGTLSKTQKQHFAKSRQLATERVSLQPSPFRGFPTFSKREAQVACNDDDLIHGMVMDEQTQSVAKRQLLQPFSAPPVVI